MDTERLKERVKESDALPVLVVGVALLVVAALPFGVAALDTPEDEWSTNVSSLNSNEQGLAAATVDGVPYRVGGENGFDDVSITERYNESADTWERVSPMPHNVSALAAASWNGSLYVFGGQLEGGGGTSDVYKYDPGSDSWSQVASMPKALSGHGAAVVNDSIYIAGGFDFSTSSETNNLYRYDPEADSWTQLTSFSSARDNHAVASLNGHVYVIAGQGGGSDVQRYYPSNDTWVSAANYSLSVFDVRAVSAGGEIYASGSDTQTNKSYVYNESQNSWTRIDDLVTGRGDHAMTVAGGVVFALGGETGSGVTADVEVYNVSGVSASGGGAGGELNESLEIDTRHYLNHNTTTPFRVYYTMNNTTTINVTSNATVTVRDPEVVSVDQQAASMTSTNNTSINQITFVNASYAGANASKEVVVANETVENIDILPPLQKWTATLGDDNSLVVVIATAIAAGVALVASSIAGVAAFPVIVTGAWVAGYVATHTLLAAILMSIFVGLNVAQVVEYSGS